MANRQLANWRRSFRQEFGETFERLGVDVNNGFGDLLAKISRLNEAEQNEIEAAIRACYAQRPDLAMVNSDKGITNLHVPSDVIIDASMPAMIRNRSYSQGSPHTSKHEACVWVKHEFLMILTAGGSAAC